MIYINHNSAIQQLEQIINSDLDRNTSYIPSKFNKQQHQALKILKKRIFLEEVIEESISFNNSLRWKSTHNSLKLVSNAEELIRVFELRSKVYTDIGYQHEFPDTIEGLNFDKYDMNAAILFYETNKKTTGTTRLIFDSQNGLPTEKKSFV